MFSTYILIFIYKYIIYILKTKEEGDERERGKAASPDKLGALPKKKKNIYIYFF